MEQFSLEKWLQDKSRKVVTRDGRPVRIVCTDRKGKSGNIVGLVGENEASVYVWNNNGKHIVSGDLGNNLVFAEEEDDFSELRESEDRKWRNWLIGHLKGYINQTDDKYAEVCKKAIAWLEKKGEQKSWSEKDDSRICQIIDWLSICKTYNPDQKSVCDISMQIAWLKSIKPNHWKPSEEQLRAIINSAQGLYQCKEKEVLLDLYEQLKNL